MSSKPRPPLLRRTLVCLVCTLALALTTIPGGAAPAPAASLVAGDLIVVDSNGLAGSGTAPAGSGKVIKVDPASGAQSVISSSGLLDYPWAVSIDAAGKILVLQRADTYGKATSKGSIVKVDPATGTQTLLAYGGSFVNPAGLVIDSTGNIIVVDSGYGETGGLIKVNPLTGEQTVIASGGSIRYPMGVAIDATGNLYVDSQTASTNLLSVVKVKPDTGEQTVIASTSIQVVLGGLAIDSTGNVYVGEIYYQNGIIKLPAGGGAGSWLSSGEYFEDPYGVALDGSGNLVVADVRWAWDGRIIRVDPATGTQTLISSGGLLVDPSGVAVVGSSPGSTPTTTPTPTTGATPTPTPTPTFTPTPTAAPVPAPTFTPTPTPTFTPTPSPTISPTPVVTSTPSATPTRSSTDAPPFQYLTQWGGPGDGDLSSPGGIAADSSGRVYVVDTGNNRIQRFDPSGAFVSQWGGLGAGNGQFDRPAGLALDQSGSVYVVDSGNNRVQKFDSTGRYVGRWGSQGPGNGQFDFSAASPTYFPGITVDGSGFIFVADSGNNRIQRFDSSGKYLGQWGAPGSGNGQIKGPGGIAVDQTGNVFVADTGNDRVQKFTSSGTYLAQWDFPGASPGGIALDASGNIYVAGQSDNRVQKLDPAGQPAGQWGSPGSGDGAFSGPTGIAVDGSGNVHVTDRGNGRVEKFTGSGTYISQWGNSGSGTGHLRSPQGIAVGTTGSLYAVDRFENTVQQFDSSGGYLRRWGESGTGAGQFDSPGAIAVDAPGNVYVVDSGNSRVQKFDPEGSYLGQWGSRGSSNGQLDTPSGMALDRQGNAYVVDRGNNRVQRFDSSGSYLGQWGGQGSGTGRFNSPTGVAVGTAGNIYVSDTGNNRVQRFNASGTYLGGWGSSGSGNGELNSPAGIAVDETGNVYVADTGNHRIQRFDPSGRYLDQVGSRGSGNGHFNSPGGLTVDGAGNIYVADTGNHRAQTLVPGRVFWSSRASMATGRSGLAVAAPSNGKVYAIGGIDANGDALATVEEYDPDTDTWTSRAGMPSARYSLGAAAGKNGKVYAIGGCCSSGGALLATVDEYDPQANTWTRRADMPTARGGLAVAAAGNGKLYAIGGADSNGEPLDTVEEYDPAANAWSTRTRMAWARESLGAAAALNGKIYAVGGANSQDAVGTVEEYDPAKDTWTGRTGIPTPRFGPGVAAGADGKVYVLGGDAEGGPFAAVEEYNPANDRWTRRLDLPAARLGAGAAVATNARLYAVGGEDPGGYSLDTVEEATILPGFQVFLPVLYNRSSSEVAQTSGAPAARPAAAPAAASPCPQPTTLSPMTDQLSAGMDWIRHNEHRDPLDWSLVSKDLIKARDELQALVLDAGWTIDYTSAFRPRQYQNHLWEMVKRTEDPRITIDWGDPKKNRPPSISPASCQPLLDQILEHGVQPNQLVCKDKATCPHVAGYAFDAEVKFGGALINPKKGYLQDPSRMKQLKALACIAGLVVNKPADRVHFELLGKSKGSCATLKATPRVTLDQPITVSWSWGERAAPPGKSWIGLYRPGDPDFAYIERQDMVNAASGSQAFTVSMGTLTNPLAGQDPGVGPYEFRLIYQEDLTRVARSNPVMVRPAKPSGLSATKGTQGAQGANAGLEPLGVAVTAGAGADEDRVQVTWNSRPEATYYKLFRGKENDVTKARLLATTPDTSYDDTGALPPGTVYWYWVKTVTVLSNGSREESDFSSGDWGKINLAIPPAPTGLVASDGAYTGKVRLAWNPSTGATQYKVFRSTSSSSGAAALISQGITGTSYDDTSALPGTTYWYWVKAGNSAGDSDFSNGDAGYAKEEVVRPPAPTGLSASDGTYDTKVRVTWNGSPGASEYKVYRAVSSDSTAAVLFGLGITGTSFDDSSVEPGKTYWYWVKASNSAGDSGFSNGNDGYAKEANPPAAPAGLTATDGTFTDKVQVTWSASTGATKYKLFRNTSNNSGTAGLIGQDIAATSFDDTSAQQGTTYWYWVKAGNSGGDSDFSNGDSGYAKAAPVGDNDDIQGRWSGTLDTNAARWCPVPQHFIWEADITVSGNNLTLKWKDTYHDPTMTQTLTLQATLSGRSATIRMDSGDAEIILYATFRTGGTVDGTVLGSPFCGTPRQTGTFQGTRTGEL